MLKLGMLALAFATAIAPAMSAPAGSDEAARELLGKWHLTESHPYPATPDSQCTITEIVFELTQWSYIDNGTRRGNGIYLYRKPTEDQVQVMTHSDIDGYTIIDKDQIKYRGATHYCIYTRVQ